MTKLFGLDIAKELNKAMGSKLLPLKLVKRTPGTRTDGALTSGTNPTSKTYPCRGVVVDFRLDQFDGDLVQRGDRKALLLGASLPPGVFPEAGDHVVAEGVESEVKNVDRDPASATYVCQVRGA